MNPSTAYPLLESLINIGVKEFCLCSGARNAPLIYAIEKLSQKYEIKIHSFYHENSAGFFAIGRIKAQNQPVVVLTTSGTAVAQLLSPIIEAYYSSLPLLVITADRPKNFRGSGAPQAIEQPFIYSQYVEKCVEIEENLPAKISWTQKSPLHINMAFEEPLLEELEFESYDRTFIHWELVERPYKKWDQEALSFSKSIVLVGELCADYRQWVESQLLRMGLPVYLEPLSGLKNLKSLQPFSLTEDQFKEEVKKSQSIIRVGGVPVHRVWRDLESLTIPVYHFTEKRYSGLAREKSNVYPIKELGRVKSQNSGPVIEGVVQQENLIPLTEPWWFYQLSQRVSEEALVFLGNSLPVRHWDSFATKDKCFAHVYANRGVNGIDGLVSTFLGLAQDYKESWCLLGDISTLYDISGFWPLHFHANRYQNKKIRFVVINNGGGQIFSKIFSREKSMINTIKHLVLPHQLQFSPLADLWGCTYKKITIKEDLQFDFSPLQFLEVIPQSDTNSVGFNG